MIVEQETAGPAEKYSSSDRGSASRGSGTTRILLAIMAGIFLWGVVHAIGVYVFSDKPNIIKSVIVMGCSAAFLGFWAIMLLSIRRKS